MKLHVEEIALEIDYVQLVPSGIKLPDVLYKYREVNKNSLSSLLCSQVYFSKPEDFNDPYEPEKIFEDSLFGSVLDRTVRESGILCLCIEPENLYMWSHYASALKGFAIGYDTSKLLKSVAPEKCKHVYEISYDNAEISAIQTQQIIQCNFDAKDPEKMKMFAKKAGVFSHEKEMRIVIEPGPDFEYCGYGLYDYDPDAISEIIFGELIPDNDEKLIRAALNGQNIVFKRAVRSKNKFKIELE